MCRALSSNVEVGYLRFSKNSCAQREALGSIDKASQNLLPVNAPGEVKTMMNQTILLLACLLPAAKVTGLIIAATLAYYIICYLFSPLKDIPGPFLAKFTNLWRVYDYYHLISPDTQKKLHAKYGTAVRLGPNLVSLNDPSLIPLIYNTRGTFRKVCVSL